MEKYKNIFLDSLILFLKSIFVTFGVPLLISIIMFYSLLGFHIDRHISNEDLKTVNSVFKLNIQDKSNIVEYGHYKGTIDTTSWSVYIKNIGDYQTFLKDNSIEVYETITDEKQTEFISCLIPYFKKSWHFKIDTFNPDIIICSTNINDKLYFFTEDDGSQSVIIQVL